MNLLFFLCFVIAVDVQERQKLSLMLDPTFRQRIVACGMLKEHGLVACCPCVTLSRLLKQSLSQRLRFASEVAMHEDITTVYMVEPCTKVS